jgi:hypothetical protein
MKKLILAALVALHFAPAKADAHFYAGCKKNPCKRHVVKPFNAFLNRLAGCESTHRWFLDGHHDGGLQFDPGTWNATGSKYSFAYQAPILEQKYRAVIWASKIGWAWGSPAGWQCA